MRGTGGGRGGPGQAYDDRSGAGVPLASAATVIIEGGRDS